MWSLTQSNVILDVTGNDGHWRVHPEGLHEATLQVFHLKGVLEGGGAV